ncbi:hypothetical protein TNCV_4990701 [Trichonephila clavipes]|nr:hypothetical protein TNCV_4990701 [Trichonephila clavipes]
MQHVKSLLSTCWAWVPLTKLNSQNNVRIIRAQVPPSGEEIECQNYLRHWYRLYGAVLKSDASCWRDVEGLQK